MKVIHVVGARPNFVKMAPVYAACARRGITQLVVHTGQHYDPNMSEVFFRQFQLPAPDFNLNVGSASHAAQTAAVMVGIEKIQRRHPADWVLVYGDVNSTLAAALVCAKQHQPLAHVEAGLRSGDRQMPEEINRIVTDQVADLLLTPSADANANLLREGVPARRIHLVGNVMIDTLLRFMPLIDAADRSPYPPQYGLVTLHRPANVDEDRALGHCLESLGNISRSIPLLFPVHPRTRKRIAGLARPTPRPALHFTEPMNYIDFLGLVKRAAFVITDSGGLQEETTCLGVPCLTLRTTTERPITIELGTNLLLGNDLARLEQAVAAILAGNAKRGRIPPLWDGQTAARIVEVLLGERRHSQQP